MITYIQLMLGHTQCEHSAVPSPHCEATHTVGIQCGLVPRTVSRPKYNLRMAEYGNRESVNLELRDYAK